MKERKIAKGIRRTRYGWRLFARVHGKLVQKRITDRDHCLSLQALREKWDDLRVDTRRRPRGDAALSATAGFARDVRDKYLPAVQARVNLAERSYHMELWIREFGSRPPLEIEPWEIARVRERWLTDGPKLRCVRWPKGEKPVGAKTGKWIELPGPLSASQVNNRLRALENFYTIVFPGQPNPVREAGEAREPEAVPRAIDYAVLESILHAMPDRGVARRGASRPDVSLTKLRLRVIAYTGFSHGELAAITAADLHLDDGEAWVWVGGRRKGQGTKGVAQPLTPEGAEALRALAASDGLGAFSRDSMRQSWRRACRAIGLEPPFPRPYDARHAFATELLAKTGNLTVVQLNMRHRDARTSRRYAERAIDPARRAGLRQAMDAGAFQPPGVSSKVSSSRESPKKTGQKRVRG